MTEVILMLLSFLMVMTLEKLMESHILWLQEEKWRIGNVLHRHQVKKLKLGSTKVTRKEL